MASILSIETATPLCSVALAINGKVVAKRETLEDKSHAAMLTVYVEEILKEKNLKIKDLDAIAIGKGPGSFTGLRIGVSTAKGLCYGSNLPLIAVSTLKVMYMQALESVISEAGSIDSNQKVLLCPMIDARRMEIFTCVYSPSGEEVEAVTAKIIVQDSFADLLSKNRMFFFGSGMDKCRKILSDPNAFFLDGIYPHAEALALLAEESYQKKTFENLAYFEPFYLKEFIATTSKKGLPV